MTDQRTIEDRLREEYFQLLPDIRRVTEQLEAEVRYCVLPILRTLDKYEQLVVTSRMKECESAIDSLRRRKQGATFDRDWPRLYTLTDLKDLAGVRVLAFPRRRVTEVDQGLRKRFRSWKADAVPGLDENDQPRAFKYYGYCKEASAKVRGEYQVASMLIGLFMGVEHSAIYKPAPELRGAVLELGIKQRRKEVYDALRAFDEEFEAVISRASFGGSD
jgi:ppGpp synthetase/RelA/SpoT-type nucleotidyltranferase